MMHRPGVLAIGNFDSNVGYAWRLMEKLWCELSDHLRPNGYDMYLCFPSISVIPKCLEEHHFEVALLDFNDTSIKAVIQQLRYLRAKSIQVIYLTDFKTISFRYMLFRLAGVKTIIVHDHTPGLRAKPSPMMRAVKATLSRFPLTSSSACFAVSPYIQQRLNEVNCIPKHKIYCVTNGISVDEPMRGPASDRSVITIVTVARATYYKGIDFSIKVLRRLLEEDVKNFHYILYGDGPDLTAFKRLAQNLGVEEHITFAGAASDIPARLADCDIAFHPSHGEAMSLAILEYMRAQLPIVVSNNPSVSSALENNVSALVYTEDSIEEAADLLKHLIASASNRNRLAMTARQRLEQDFSEDAMRRRFRVALDGSLRRTHQHNASYQLK